MNNSVSLSIRSEIQRFESVHPSIYSIYELIDHLPQSPIANLIREHVVNIEDNFVNSQEWTLSRSVEEIRIAILGSQSSQKSTLVHRYLTSEYLEDNSPEGGRFKKELLIKNKPYMLLLRDEGSSPELELTHWLDVLILVANSVESVTTCYSYVSRLASYKSLTTIPILLVSVDKDEHYINEFKKIPHNNHINVDIVNGINVEEAFNLAVQLVKNISSACAELTPRNRRRSNIFSKKSELGVGRVIPIKQGYLNKRSKNDKLKKWKKKYVILTNDNRLSYYDNINNYMDNGTAKSIELKHANVKKIDTNHFTVNTINKIFEFECNNELCDNWIENINKLILHSIQGKEITNETQLNSILKLTGNNFCADCRVGITDSYWVSINFGVVICIDCSGIHRNLGSHISRVRSLHLDQLSAVTLSILESMEGNAVANSRIYENMLQRKVIDISSTMEEKSLFIRRKYEKLEFVPQKPKEIYETLKNKDFLAFLPALFQLHKNNLIQFEDLILFIINTVQEPTFLQICLWTCWDDLDTKNKQNVKAKINKITLNDPNIKSILLTL